MKTSTSTHNLSQFTTATLGAVRHPSNLLMEFLEIWQKTHKVKSKAEGRRQRAEGGDLSFIPNPSG